MLHAQPQNVAIGLTRTGCSESETRPARRQPWVSPARRSRFLRESTATTLCSTPSTSRPTLPDDALVFLETKSTSSRSRRAPQRGRTAASTKQSPSASYQHNNCLLDRSLSGYRAIHDFLPSCSTSRRAMDADRWNETTTALTVMNDDKIIVLYTL